MTSQPAIRERDKNGHLKAGIRLPGWDYCKPWFYMITLVVKRRRPILGEIRDGAFVPSPLGEAVARALGDKKGIRRYGNFLLPMDESLALIALDLSGRPYLVYDLVPPAARIRDLDTALFKEFFQALCVKGGINLHIRLLSGAEVHHVFEAVFKGLGRALAQAVEMDPRETGIPSTKGSL